MHNIGKYCVPVKLGNELGYPSFFAEGLDTKNQRCEDGSIIKRNVKYSEN